MQVILAPEMLFLCHSYFASPRGCFVLPDVNECESPHPICSHICIDKPIGYKCECPRGYHLDKDNTTCRGECDTATRQMG